MSAARERLGRVLHDARGAVGTADQAFAALARLTPGNEDAEALARAGRRTLARLLRRVEVLVTLAELEEGPPREPVTPIPLGPLLDEARDGALADGARHPLILPKISKSLIIRAPRALLTGGLRELFTLALRHAHGPVAVAVTFAAPRQRGPLTITVDVPLHARARLVSGEALGEDDRAAGELLQALGAALGGGFAIAGAVGAPRTTFTLTLAGDP